MNGSPKFANNALGTGAAFAAVLLLIAIWMAMPTHASAQEAVMEGGEGVIVIDDASSPEILAFGKKVVVRTEAKNVLVFGGDVLIEGSVLEDVAAVGGSVVQRPEASIGGDVFVLGGAYRAEGTPPKRSPGRETLVYAGYEEEIRELVLNPSSVLYPEFSWSFLAQRFLSLLFWFILTTGIATAAPGAVGRAVTTFRAAPVKVTALGISGFLLVSIGLILSLSFLPSVLSTAVGLMVLVLLLVSYIFGRSVMQVTVGKSIQKALFPGAAHSEVLTVFIGVMVWTLVLSVPYLWTAAALFLFSVSVGLVWTAIEGSRSRV